MTTTPDPTPTPETPMTDTGAEPIHPADDDPHATRRTMDGWAIDEIPADIPTTVTPNLEAARHAEAFASAQAATARFRALSDAAGNPGAETRWAQCEWTDQANRRCTTFAPHRLARHDDEYSVDGFAVCGPHRVVALAEGWTDPEAEQAGNPGAPTPTSHAAIRQGRTNVCVCGELLDSPTHTPDVERLVGVNDVAELASGPIARPGEPLASALNRLGELVAATAANVAALRAEVTAPAPVTAAGVDWFTRAGANDPTADVITRARRWLTHCGPDRGVSDTTAGMHLARLVGELLEAIPAVGAPAEAEPWTCPECGQATLRTGDAPTDEETCGATLDQGCNVTGDVHRCASRPNGHSLGGARLTHACSCGTRWPLDSDTANPTEGDALRCPQCGGTHDHMHPLTTPGELDTEGDDRRPLDLRGHACTRPVGPPGPPYGEPPACGQPAIEVDVIGRPRCAEHLAMAQTATSADDEAETGDVYLPTAADYAQGYAQGYAPHQGGEA